MCMELERQTSFSLNEIFPDFKVDDSLQISLRYSEKIWLTLLANRDTAHSKYALFDKEFVVMNRRSWLCLSEVSVIFYFAGKVVAGVLQHFY